MANLTIWHELDHPIHPLNDDRQTSILTGAQVASNKATGMREQPYLDVMRETLGHDILGHESYAQSREWFIGTMIGARAGLLELDVSDTNSPGFEIVKAQEMHDLRTMKVLGIDLGQQFGRLLSTTAALRTAIHQEPRTTQTPTELIGLAIGLRYAELSNQGAGV